MNDELCTSATPDDGPEGIARAIDAVARLSAVPSLLKVICETTGMGFAVVAHVTEGTWTACAVQDDIQFGLVVGSQLDIRTTLCREARADRQPVVIDQASTDPVYRNHRTPKLYHFESYISVPIVMSGGVYFGNLCAVDPRPVKLSEPRTVGMFTRFAELIAMQLDNEAKRVEAEAALHDARITAELREQFIAVLGHDLRNPLAAVGATGELLLRRPEPELKKMGDRLRSSTRRMVRLLDDVLDFARSRMGSGIGVQRAAVDDLQTALRDVVSELRETHLAHDLRDHIVIDVTVRCDRGRVQQLLSNLLANALAYGAIDAPIEVAAAVDDGWLQISVANRGEPIPPESLIKVFEPYWRPATSKPGGGLGLGLHICAQIVKTHGGRLEVASTAATGTRFTARLPI